jgi:hypothetical protein
MSQNTGSEATGTARVKRGMAEMLKGGVIMDVVNVEQAKIAEDAGACAVMALERVPADIRAQGGVARMSDPDMIEKIKSAVTDAGREVTFDQIEKPGISNLLTIHSSLSGISISQLENDFAGKGYGDFKSAVAEVVVEYLRPIRERAQELLLDEKHLISILHQGSEKARTVASATLNATYKGLGVVQ